jgi:hypothetical protein
MTFLEIYAVFGVPAILLALGGAAYWWVRHTTR